MSIPESNRGADQDLDAELRAHLTLLVDEKIRAGLSPFAAHRAALLEMGGTTQVAEAVRDARRGAWLREIGRDARYAMRMLRRDLAFTITAAATLAIGLGANVAIFTIANALLWRTLPVREPERLVAVGKPTAIDPHITGDPRADLFSLPLYYDLRDHNRLVTGLAAVGTTGRLDVPSATDAEPEHPMGRFVSGNYFDVLGVGAEGGRLLRPADDVRGAAPVAVISDGYWRRQLGAQRDVVGHTVIVDGVSLTIVGVAAPGFRGEIAERATDIWIPLNAQPLLQPHSAPIDRRETQWLVLLGRLAPNVTMSQARAGFTTLIHELLAANATSESQRRTVRRLATAVGPGAGGYSAARRAYGPALLTLAIGVALLLAVVCTNVANLLLARAIARGRELTLRLALGASRRRLLRQLMTESTVLAGAGVVPGLFLAWWASRTLVTMAGLPALEAGEVDVHSVLFLIGLTIVVVIAFGLAPALQASRADLSGALRARGAAGPLRRRGRHGRVPIGARLVPLQVTLSLVLLVGAALLARNLTRLLTADAGLDRERLLIADVDLSRSEYTGNRLLSFIDAVQARISAIPGVRAVSYSQNGLFYGGDGTAVVSIPGFTGRTEEDSTLHYDLVGPGYVHAIGGRLLRGRDIDARDTPKAPSVAVVNETLEHFYFGGNAVGKTIYFDAGVPTTIVGVVADVRDHSLVSAVPRRAYAPYAQNLSDSQQAFLRVEIRTAGDPASVMREVRATLVGLDRNIPLGRLAPLSTLMEESVAEERLLTLVAISFGGVAVLLAAIGLYGVMSYAVDQRTAELGVRCALGAERGDVLRLVLGDAFRLVAVGAAIGAPLAFLVTQLLRSQLTNVPASDPFALSLALAVLLSTAAIAALVPALRASRVPPVVALRGD